MTDWSKCPAVESVPGRVSGAWVFKDTRLPVSPFSGTLRRARLSATSSSGSAA